MFEAQATWCTVPAPGTPAPRPAAGRRRRDRRGTAPRASHACSPAGVKPSVPSRSSRLASGAAANARTLSKPWRACSAGISGCLATSGASPVATTASSSPRPSGSSKPEPGAAAPRRDPLALPSRASQKSSASSEATPERDRVHHPGPGPAAAGARVLEEGDVGARGCRPRRRRTGGRRSGRPG